MNNKTILLADDSVTIQKVVELTFMDEDYRVVAVGNGEEAMARFPAVNPDVLIADVHMPGPNGYELCERAKKLRPALPVLLLVGTFEPFDQKLASECGADAFLKKPFDSQELLKLVGALIAKAEGRPAAVPTPGPAQVSSGFGGEDLDLEATPTVMLDTPSFALDDDEDDISRAPTMRLALAPEEAPDEAADDTPEEEAAAERQQAGFVVAETDDDEPHFRLEPPPEHAEIEEDTGAIDTDDFRIEFSSVGESTEEPRPADDVTTPEFLAVPNEPAASAAHAAGNGAGLSSEELDRVARRVVEILSERIVREVAWEVVPDLAEVLIKERLRELESQVE